MDRNDTKIYENVDVYIGKYGTAYRANVRSASAGEGQADVDLRTSLEKLDGFLFNVGQARRRARGRSAARMTEARKFGEQLFDSVFQNETLGCLQRSFADAEANDHGTRLRIHLVDTPELSDLPWEFLYDGMRGRFLSLSANTPIIRYLDCPERLRAIGVTPPLRILAIISSPTDYPRLDVEREWNTLQDVLSDLIKDKLVELERIEKPQLASLPRALKKPFHVLHFVGHGEFIDDVGQLVFEDEWQRGKLVPADRLGVILRDHASLRLVVLNSCEGARSSTTDPFSGTAQTLVRQGIPAVLAMQFEITDEAAITVASEFYTSVAIGDPIDIALADARLKLFAIQDDGVEWATPVLYLRSPDSRIFDVEQTETVRRRRDEDPAARMDPVAVTTASIGSDQNREAPGQKIISTGISDTPARPADTWVEAVNRARTPILSWFVFGPFFLALLILPQLFARLLSELAVQPLPWLTRLELMAVLALVVGLSMAIYGRLRTRGKWITNVWYFWCVLVPIVTAAICLSGAARMPVSQRAWLFGAVMGSAIYAVAGSLGWLLTKVLPDRKSDQPKADGSWGMGCAMAGAWILSGALVGTLISIGSNLGDQVSDNFPIADRDAILVVFGVGWLLLSILLGELLYTGLTSSARGDMDQEWFARSAGWMVAAAVSWAIFAAIALYGPLILDRYSGPIPILLVGAVSGGILLAYGTKARTAASAVEWGAIRLPVWLIAGLVSVLFRGFLAILLARADAGILGMLFNWIGPPPPEPGAFPAIASQAMAALAVSLFLLSLALSVPMRINRTRFIHALFGLASDGPRSSSDPLRA